MFYRPPIIEDAKIVFMYEIGKDNSYQEKHGLIATVPNVTIPGNKTQGVKIKITAANAGHLILGVNSSSQELTE